MRRSWITILSMGAIGGIAGLFVLALAAARVFGSGIVSVEVLNEPARATFVVGQAALYVLVVVAGAFGGALIAVMGYAAARIRNPQDERFPISSLAAVGALSGAVLVFAIARTALGVGGTISGGVVSISVFRAAMVALITGSTTGIVIGWAAERLSRPEVFGFEGAAWPSRPAFMRDAAAAMGLPTIAIVLSLGIVFALSQVLLEADHTTSLIAFGGIAALILFGGAVIAAMPPRREPGDAGDRQ